MGDVMLQETKLGGIDTPKPKRQKYGGRKKGSRNKITATIKESVLQVFEALDGIDGMAAWARENRTEFYRIAARLIPTEQQITGAGGKALSVRVSFVAPSLLSTPSDDGSHGSG